MMVMLGGRFTMFDISLEIVDLDASRAGNRHGFSARDDVDLVDRAAVGRERVG